MEIVRESLFTSAWRAFFKTFFGVCGFFLALLPAAFFYMMFSSEGDVSDKTQLTYLPNAEDKIELSRRAPIILQIDIHGVIGGELLNVDVIRDQLIDSQKGVLKGRVKGILLHMKTPGGTVSDSDGIYRLLMEYKKKYNVPVFAYMEELCASGGMYVSSAVDKAFASPGCIVGSVGVLVGPFFNVVQTLDKIGMQTKTLTAGKNKDAMTPFRPWEKDEDESYKNLTKYFYEQFTSVFLAGHPRVNKQKLLEEYGANVFDPMTAERIGYVDSGSSSYREALVALLEKCGIKKEATYQVVRLTPKTNWLANLLKEKSPILSGKIEHGIDKGELSNSFGRTFYLYKKGDF